MPETTFSFIIPTRGRPESLLCLCDSIRATTRAPERLEIVLVVDRDDEASCAFQYPGLDIRKIQVAPGLNMGALNMAGYRAAVGKYLMLLNDDIVLQTRGWDDQVLEVFRNYPDGIVLVHVNETIFRERLCTFPFLTRTFCELAQGICPEEYVRYRIDDHIHNIFDLLTLFGPKRRVFLPDVVFQHLNTTETETGPEYVPKPEIHAFDTLLFDALLPARKQLALAAMELIDRRGSLHKRRNWEASLEPANDSVALRDPRHALLHPPDRPARVTVAVVSADMRGDTPRKCLELVKAHTNNYDLVIVDNNRDPGFNHAREMNRLIEFCRTEYFVLMDDDVFVQEGWLEGMMRAMTPEVGVVTPLHTNARGEFSYAGVVMNPDESGAHTHVMKIGDRPQHIQTLCSAIMLIHMGRCGHVRLNETFTKYFLDIDYGLQIWEQGYRVVCSPWTTVTHIGGGTLVQGSELGVQLFEQHRRHYVRLWVDTRRIHALHRGIWRELPEIAEIGLLKREIDSLLFEVTRLSRETLFSRVRALNNELASFPALRDYLAGQAGIALGGRPPRADDPDTGGLAILLGFAGQPVMFEANFHGMNIVLGRGRFYALPNDEGNFDYDRIRQGGYTRSFEAEDPGRIRELILASPVPSVPDVAPQPTALAALAPAVPPPPDRDPVPAGLIRRLLSLAPYVSVLTSPVSRPWSLFDAEYYRRSYPDVAAAGVNPFLHFLITGGFEGRNPHPLFDSKFYLQRHPDVAASQVNPLLHYLKYGAREGRQPHPLFDPIFYRDRYPDVHAARVNPLLHFVLHGASKADTLTDSSSPHTT
jgi:GT2 family glycosyltransferase